MEDDTFAYLALDDIFNRISIRRRVYKIHLGCCDKGGGCVWLKYESCLNFTNPIVNFIHKTSNKWNEIVSFTKNKYLVEYDPDKHIIVMMTYPIQDLLFSKAMFMKFQLSELIFL